MTEFNHKSKGIYEFMFKRPFDILCALFTIIVFSWLFIIVAILVRVKLGSPVIFKQPRPGRNEKIFNLYKFRTMTNEKDENGKLLPDEVRLTSFGKWLRNTSLDELPECFNVLFGTMSIVGPRPLLVRDMVFMNDEQRKRHSVRQGITGLAQINGRNEIDWEDKFVWDVKYTENITFLGDVKIIIDTFKKAIIKNEGITQVDMATVDDFGDYLLVKGKITKEEYDKKQSEALDILKGNK